MSENKNDSTSDEKHLTDHEYDGIRELDYSLPNWWKNLFYATILFSALYVVWYDMLRQGPTIEEEYRAQQSKLEAVLAAQAAQGPKLREEDFVSYVKDPAKLKQGAEAFEKTCAVCHGNLGQGLIGPNLTDDYWLHGAKLVQIAQVVSKGVPEKGMPPWDAVLSGEQVRSVVAYIRSIRGSNPAGAKSPQGEIVKE